MPRYSIETLEKKNIWSTEIWHDADTDRGFDKVEMYRWGYVVINTEEPLDIEEVSKNEHGFHVSDYEIEDQLFDDGCALYFEDFINVEEEYVDQLWENDYYMGLEDDGFEIEEVNNIFYGPLKIVEIKE